MRLPFGYELVRSKELDDSRSQVSSGITGSIVHGANSQLSGAPDNGNSGSERKVSTVDQANLSGVGGRKTVESLNTWDKFSQWTPFALRTQHNALGLGSRFDLDQFTGMQFDDLSELLADLSPEISKALWDFQLMCNNGYTLKAFKPGSNYEIPDKKGQKALDAIMKQIASYHGTEAVWFDRIFKTMFLRGSFLMELILAANQKDFVDIATPDPRTLTFKRVYDNTRGQHWGFGQIQMGEYVPLNDLPHIKYVPVHPSPDSIEGHSLCGSAFFVAIFLMSVLRDLKRVIQHQGYDRLDVEIDFMQLVEAMPTEAQGDPQKQQEWMDRVVAEVNAVYSKLKPDDTYVHGNAIKINKPVGTASSDSLNAMGALFEALERMATRALKSMPILMFTRVTRTETQANREWEIYAKGIEIIQHLVESPTENMLELALQAQGIQSDVRLRFTQLRASEAMRDAQVDLLKSKTARENYDNGYWSQDEAALYATQKQSADNPEPRKVATSNPFVQGGGADGAVTGNPETNPDPLGGAATSNAENPPANAAREVATNGNGYTRKSYGAIMQEIGLSVPRHSVSGAPDIIIDDEKEDEDT